jgi:serine/threonine-protein kinase
MVMKLVISKGPQFLVVPEVRGQQVQDATRLLQQMGFNVSVVGFGTVRNQNPEPNTPAPPGTTVTLYALF